MRPLPAVADESALRGELDAAAAVRAGFDAAGEAAACREREQRLERARVVSEQRDARRAIDAPDAIQERREPDLRHAARFAAQIQERRRRRRDAAQDEGAGARAGQQPAAEDPAVEREGGHPRQERTHRTARRDERPEAEEHAAEQREGERARPRQPRPEFAGGERGEERAGDQREDEDPALGEAVVAVERPAAAELVEAVEARGQEPERVAGVPREPRELGGDAERLAAEEREGREHADRRAAERGGPRLAEDPPQDGWQEYRLDAR